MASERPFGQWSKHLAKAELGDKQVCPNCASKFYDLRRRPATCPKCGTAFDPADETVRLKRAKTTRAPAYVPDYEDDEDAPKKKVAAEAEEEGFEEEVEEAPELVGDGDEVVDEVISEDDEEPTNPDALPAGFAEADEDADLEADEAVEDEGVPLLEDDEEGFPDDELDPGDGPEDGEDR